MKRFVAKAMALVWLSAAAQAQPAAPADALPMSYLNLGTIATPVVDDYRLLGTLQVRLVLKVDDRDVRAKLTSAKPRLVDAYNRALADFSRSRIDPSRPVDINRLSSLLQRATDRLVPAGTARLLVLEAMVRRG